jgi:hypothetical protein
MRTLWNKAREAAAIALIGFGLASQPLLAQAPATPLTALDYAEIQQLVNRLNFALDYCGNGGRDFAELFADGGQYVIDQGDGKPRVTQGAEELAKLAGGPDCKAMLTPPRSYLAHVSENLVVEASAEGARGKAYAIYPSSNGKYLKDDIAGQVGLYHDIYVRTPKGWRFKLRRHEVSPAAVSQAR